MALVVNSTNPDLSRFRDRGGKLIQYAGWGDTAIAPQSGLNYYRKVSSVTGDVHNFYRVFMAPGMAHCYGGPGPNSFGNGDNHEMWVEWGVAPEKIIATKYFDDDPAKGVALQRPLCPYPQISKYNGRARTSDPSSFECAAAKSHHAPRNRGLQNAYR
jgi:feruloyl esterase